MRNISGFILVSFFALLLGSCSGGGTPPPVPNLNLQSSSLEEEVGETVSISWTSLNATSCIASGDWSGEKGLSGSESVLIGDAKTYIFGLNCSGKGGSSSKSVSVDGFQITVGVTVDGYIRAADIFIDQNENFVADSDEQIVISDDNGGFSTRYSKGNLISLGGFDLDSGVLLDNLLLVNKLDEHIDFAAITPITTVMAFMDIPSDIHSSLGIDSSIAIATTDPVAMMGDGGIYDFLFEKGNQVTVLALAMQNISNDLNISIDTSQDYFKSIAEELEQNYADTQAKVDIEDNLFIRSVINNIVSSKSLALSEESQTVLADTLASVMPVIEVKDDLPLNAALFGFATSTFQSDIQSVANGTASEEKLNSYKSDIINYIASDQNVSANDLTPEVRVSGDVVSTSEDQALDILVLSNDSLVLSAPFNIVLESPSNGSVELNNQVVSYTPNPDFNGIDTFNYTVVQGDKSASGLVTVDVKAVNDAPSFNNLLPRYIVPENEVSVVTVFGIDVDEDALTYSLSGIDSESFSLDDQNNLVFKAAPDFERKTRYSVSISVSDGVEVVIKEVIVEISNVNDVAPVIGSSASFSAAENQTGVGSVSASDAEGDALTYSISGSELVISASGVLSFASAPDYETKSSYSATVTVNDGVNSATQEVTVAVTNVNDVAPVIGSSASFSAAENQTGVGSVSASDAEGDALTYSISGSELVISASGVLSFASAPDYETKSSYSATVTVNDGVNSATQEVTVAVTNVNEAPVISSSSSFSAAENQTGVGSVSASDAEGDALTYSVSGSELVISSSGVLSFASAPNYETKSSYSATVTVNDGVNEISQGVSVSVSDVNDPPIATPASYYLNLLPQLQTAGTISLAGTDEDGDPLTYSIVSNGSFGSATISGSTITYTTSSDTQAASSESFTFKVNDGSVDSPSATVSISLKTDPLYQYQWHLNNVGQTNFATNPGTSGADLNVDTVISGGITGSGVTVAVIDEGLELGHEDLVDNVVAGSWDFVNSDSDPTSDNVSGDHGTSVAGIIAAKGWNNIGVRGVAPNASIIGYNFIKSQDLSNQLQSWGSSPPVAVDVDIYNMSYGSGPTESGYALPSFMGSSQEAALISGVTNLRAGKGAIYIQSAGNGFAQYPSASCGTYLSCTEAMIDVKRGSPYILPVAALNADGTISSYSTPGSGLWISGFGGETGNNTDHSGLNHSSGNKPAIMTVDQASCSKGYTRTGVSAGSGRNYNTFNNGDNSENSSCNYASTFNGTSSAAPSVAGVVALMLEANPDLTWRDVKHILATTADQVSPSLSYTYQGLVQYEWETNSAGYKFHNRFGFGKIDAAEAVTTATSYTPDSRGIFVSTPYAESGVINSGIVYPNNTTSTITVTKPAGSNDFVEYVRVSVQFSHSIPNSVGLRLMSPDGTIINIMQPMTNLSTNPSSTLFDIGVSGLYGESIEGVWTIAANDYLNDGTTGTLIKWGIKVYGN
ncbi:Ig-like domain-containing protein [SAR92 clade bacterium H231]|nr:Ig-like domain-containing protein [SAR92 clade bacterium H231]